MTNRRVEENNLITKGKTIKNAFKTLISKTVIAEEEGNLKNSKLNLKGYNTRTAAFALHN